MWTVLILTALTLVVMVYVHFRGLPMVVQKALSHWLDYWHGYGEIHQYRYYRCEGCRALVTHRRIRTGGCSCGLSTKVRPAVLSRLDMARCLLAPWSVAR